MFQGFTKEAVDFLTGIRNHNEKEWFEAHKDIYLAKVYEPLKVLGELLFEPYSDIPDMIHKVARIYKDANFPPYLHYRDTMWIYVRHAAMYWSKTPTLFFEISPEGAEFGFRIPKPDAKVMERFRQRISAEPEPFLQMMEQLETAQISVGGEEYKRAKPCQNEALLPYFKKKGLSASVHLPVGEELFSGELDSRIHEVFAQVFPLHEYFQEIVVQEEIDKLTKNLQTAEESEPPMVKAPQEDFMW